MQPKQLHGQQSTRIINITKKDVQWKKKKGFYRPTPTLLWSHLRRKIHRNFLIIPLHAKTTNIKYTPNPSKA